MKWLVPGAALAVLCAAAPASSRAEQAALVNPDKMRWAPLDAIPGTEIAVLSGDPAKQGFFVIEWRGPAGTKALPHWHSNTEQIAMVSGSGLIGMGDKVDLQKGAPLGPGGYGEMPGRMHHWFVAQGPFAMIIEGNGPFDVSFVNPEDDPRKNPSKQ